MARTKATPVRREVSEEYFSREMRSRKGASTTSPVTKKEVEVQQVATEKEAGALEVAIAVGGIYASL